METTTEITRVEQEVAIAASPETVWEFFVDADKATRWMGIDASLEPTDAGTLLRLTHELPRDSAAPHAEGWEHYLSRLAVAAEGADPGADPWLSR